MQAFTDARDETTADELWVVEHPGVFTQGQAGKAEHILDAGDIPVIQVDRGGQVTYHGPGQIVMYPLIDIKRLGLGVKALVSGIEQAIIDVLSGYGVEAGRLENAPGVYVDGVKIASLGLRIRKGRSFHGLAFNVDMDLGPFSRINPCGFENLQVTSLAALVGQVDMDEVEGRLLRRLARALGYNEKFRVVDGGLPGDQV
jgi:lipoyl(octanoyl) transferase